MKWEMELEDVEAVLETIWDLHDKISDAIHAISRSHFLKTIKTTTLTNKPNTNTNTNSNSVAAEGGRTNGFVFVKDFRGVDDDENDDDIAVMAEARSLNAIRTALENLEDQLEFFHTVQSQQRSERDAAIARLEQSRIILVMRLADHQGKKYKVIEEAQAFVGNVHDAGRFVAPDNLFEMPRSQSGENLDDHKGKRFRALMQMLISSLSVAKDSFKFERIGGVLGNAALFAVSMLALLQLHQVATKPSPQLTDKNFYRSVEKSNQPDISSKMKHFDVFSARG